MRAEGVIVAVDGGCAIVSVLQQSACAGCSASCATCHKKVSHKIIVENTISAQMGDIVWVESSATRILLICFFVFIIPPVLAGICCALLWDVVGVVALTSISIGVAFLCFMLLYLTLGKKLIAGNDYKLVKKY